jgi:YolD-like protein
LIRDRGNIKWTSLMLPEHVKELRHYIHEEYHDVQEPTLDEQQMEEMNEVIMKAMEHNIPLAFSVYRNKRLNIVRGSIHYLDLHKNELRILDSSDNVRILSFSEVKGIEKLD